MIKGEIEMSKIGQLLMAAFGPVGSYIQFCGEAEKSFWLSPPKGASLWQAARHFPNGRWYLIKAFMARTIAPRAIVLLILFYAFLGVINSSY